MSLTELVNQITKPQQGESVLILVDEPHGDLEDSEAWFDRRTIWAEEWKQAYLSLGIEDVEVVRYKATGKKSGALPDEVMDLARTNNIVISMPEFSATGPLHGVVKEKGSITRVVSMPAVSRQFEDTFFTADYSIIARRAIKGTELLNRAVGAKVLFSNGSEMYFDLRDREAEADTGYCHKAGTLINFPSGEFLKTLYENVEDDSLGESLTSGTLPLLYKGEVILCEVEKNRITSVLTDSETGKAFAEWILEGGVNRNNIAEFACGVNSAGQRTGITLGDEKLQGAHIALGTSKHLGGKVTSDQHEDFIYAEGDELHVTTMTLIYQGIGATHLIRDGKLQMKYLD